MKFEKIVSEKRLVKKSLICFLWMLFFSQVVLSQSSISRSVPAKGIHTVKGLFQYCKTKLVATDGQEIKISGKVQINEGENDDAFFIDTQVSNGTVFLSTNIKNFDQLPRSIYAEHNGQTYFFDVDGNYHEKLEKIRKQMGTDEIEKFSEMPLFHIELVVEVPRNMILDVESRFEDVELANFNNRLKVFTQKGIIRARFDKKLPNGDVELKSSFNMVEVTLPDRVSVNVEMRTQFGSLNSEFEIDQNSTRSSSSKHSKLITGTINGGGTNLVVESTHKDVFIKRK
ncbi:MAG: hypothetical protein AAGA10_09790 [Bacteroidota bacterium]